MHIELLVHEMQSVRVIVDRTTDNVDKLAVRMDKLGELATAMLQAHECRIAKIEAAQ